MFDNPKRLATRDGTVASNLRRPGVCARIMGAISRFCTSRCNMRAGLLADSLVSAMLIVAGFGHGHLRMAWAALTVLGGLFVFTFIEYAAHRWLFHGNGGPFKVGHAHHHDDPLGYDALPFILPPLFMLSLAALFTLAMPTGYALLLAGAIAAGYAVYGLSHVAVHVRHFRNPLWRRWAGFHHIHHCHPGSNFGVTTGLWDVVLGTRYMRHPRPAPRRA